MCYAPPPTKLISHIPKPEGPRAPGPEILTAPTRGGIPLPMTNKEE